MTVVQTTPYMQAEEILQAARVLCNDAALSLAGDILSDQQPYIFTMLETCYEDLQDRLIKGGVNTYFEYTVIPNLTPVQSTDPATQVLLTYTGYYDGATTHQNPQLPSDLLMPLELWERQSGSQQAWLPMGQAPDHLSTQAQNGRFFNWDWEMDILYLPGAVNTNDLKMKYLLYAPRLTTGNSAVLVARCKVALSNLLACAAAKSRGGTGAATQFAQDAKEAINRMIDRTAQKDQRVAFTRAPFRSRRRRF